jgi:hypothetical protein
MPVPVWRRFFSIQGEQMDKHFFTIALLAGLACGSACAVPAGAPAATDSVAPAPAPARKMDGLGTPLKQEQLAALRGGADTASATAQLGATVANNSASNLSSGSNTIDGGAFANMSGLPMVIQNTGANVLIQNATVINLQLR